MLDVYEAVVANDAVPKEQRQPLWAIGESLKLVPDAMPHKWNNPYETRKNMPQ